MLDIETQESWYVVLTKPRQEERAAQNLNEQGGEVFLPYIPVEKILRGNKVTQQDVMFPGYVFLKTANNSPLLSKVRSTPGARMLLRFAVEPVIVHQTLIDDLKGQCVEEQSEAIFKIDQQVRINAGPFKDYLALFKEYDGEKRAIVLLSLLNQQQKLALELIQLSA